jgi:hypothetical protein
MASISLAIKSYFLELSPIELSQLTEITQVYDEKISVQDVRNAEIKILQAFGFNIC